jgi:uncharacterized membrane protein
MVKREWTLKEILPWILLIGGLIGLVASLALCIEKFDSLQNPQYHPVCNLNPIFSCSTVSSSQQSHLFGFYNPFIGLAAYGAVATIGLGLLAGARFKKWFWQVAQAGLSLSMVFITWLQFQALYRIGALCVFCMVVWAVTGPMFWYLTLYDLQAGNIKVPKRLKGIVAFAQKHHGDILLVWFLLIIALILKRFWYYWSSLI